MEIQAENNQKAPFKTVIMKIVQFFKTNFIFSIVVLMAIVSMIFVPPDKGYGDYFEWSTISTIFLILLVVAGLININFFETVARFIVKCTGQEAPSWKAGCVRKHQLPSNPHTPLITELSQRC